MMGDHLKKVKSGDPLRLPAATFNTFIDASRDCLARQQNVGGGPRPGRRASRRSLRRPCPCNTVKAPDWPPGYPWVAFPVWASKTPLFCGEIEAPFSVKCLHEPRLRATAHRVASRRRDFAHESHNRRRLGSGLPHAQKRVGAGAGRTLSSGCSFTYAAVTPGYFAESLVASGRTDASKYGHRSPRTVRQGLSNRHASPGFAFAHWP